MTKITVSYRRNDSDAITGRIFDRLVAHYGADAVFRDIDNIPPGFDYRKYISDALASTDILLAIVGPQWIGRTSDGIIRIQEPTDLVRIEVEAALRKDIPVVPVLVGHANMPQPTDLPDGLQDFAFRHAVKVDAQEDFDDHVRRLIRSLDRLLPSQLSSTQQERLIQSLDRVLVKPTGISEKAAEEQKDRRRVSSTIAVGAREGAKQRKMSSDRNKPYGLSIEALIIAAVLIVITGISAAIATAWLWR